MQPEKSITIKIVKAVCFMLSFCYQRVHFKMENEITKINIWFIYPMPYSVLSILQLKKVLRKLIEGHILKRLRIHTKSVLSLNATDKMNPKFFEHVYNSHNNLLYCNLWIYQATLWIHNPSHHLCLYILYHSYPFEYLISPRFRSHASNLTHGLSHALLCQLLLSR